jgi:hypothetical protein
LRDADLEFSPCSAVISEVFVVVGRCEELLFAVVDECRVGVGSASEFLGELAGFVACIVLDDCCS